jgi:O-antigen ligase
VIYTAAHNDYLQVLAEGGALLTVPAVACIVALAVTIRRRFKEETSRSTFWIRAGATIGILTIALQEIGEFSLQIPGNAFLFAVVCAVAIHQTPERRPRTAS